MARIQLETDDEQKQNYSKRAKKVNRGCVSDQAETKGTDNHSGDKLSNDHRKAKFVEEEAE
jgi:hypothetical protein